MMPYSPIPRFVRGAHHHSLIQRTLRPNIDSEFQRLDLITTTRLRLSVIDSGSEPEEHPAEGDTCIHILWQADEADAHISIGGDQYPIAPGDTAWIPAGDSWQLSPNQLTILIAVRSSSLALHIEPTHGKDDFSGYNRESRYPGTPVAVSRWKLTEPLRLAPSDQDVILVGLYADIAIQFDGGVSMLRQGEASVIRPGLGQITLVPNGLSYVLILDNPTGPKDQLE